jgi:hypothetical protein
MTSRFEPMILEGLTAKTLRPPSYDLLKKQPYSSWRPWRLGGENFGG